jgi:hypothetical protein
VCSADDPDTYRAVALNTLENQASDLDPGGRLRSGPDELQPVHRVTVGEHPVAPVRLHVQVAAVASELTSHAIEA